MAKKCEFIVSADQCLLRTKTNGDHVHCDKMRIAADDAADLAWMIQSGQPLKVKITIEGE